MNIRNFLKKIISRFKEAWNGNSNDREVKTLRPLSMDFFFPNIMGHNTEIYFQKGGQGSNREEYLCTKNGCNIKNIKSSGLLSFESIRIKNLNLCENCIFDRLDLNFVLKSKNCNTKFSDEKLFKIVIGKSEDRPIVYMN